MDRELAFPVWEYQARAERVEAAMDQAGLDALVGYSVSNAPGPAAYLAGYEPRLGLHDVAFVVLAPGAGHRHALLTNAFWDGPANRTWMEEVVITADFAGRLAALLPDRARRVGIAGLPWLPAPVLDGLRAALPGAAFVDATRLLWEVAAVKSPAEIEVLRACSRMTDAGVAAFLGMAHEGATERELRAEVERAILLAGADGLSFGVQIYTGRQVAVGIGFDRDRVLAAGEQAQVDCGAAFRGYRGDLSRVTTAGPASEESHRTMEATAEMYEAMLASIRPGVPVADVARAGLRAARRRGMEEHVYRSPNHSICFLGHGIGCWYHQLPEIQPEAPGVLEVGMILVLEPILTWPRIAGAKIEDAVLVTAAGAERLSALPLGTWPV